MEYQEIKIKIDDTGKVFVEVVGVKGKKCLELTKDLEKKLGDLLERKTKPEFYDDTEKEDNYLNTSL
jgi:hypothetical protein